MGTINIFGFLLTLMTCYATIEILSQTSGSTDQQSVKWERYTVESCGTSRWNRVVSNGIRSYSTCTSRNPSSTPCSLITEDWELPDEINTVYLNIQGDMNNCSNIVSVAGYDKCTSYYVLKAYIGNSINADSYKNISNIPLRTTGFVPGTKLKRYNDTILIQVTGYKHIRLKFETTYWCGVINGVKMYYYSCPTTSAELVHFNQRPAPSGSDAFEVYGRCTSNADLGGFGMPKMTCYSNGSATIHGKCICREGYHRNNHQCDPCKKDEYKSEPGNSDCKKCGMNSQSGKTVGVKCICNDLYFRKRGSEKNFSRDCYRPPDAPSKITISNITHDYVQISWTAPADSGSSPLGEYHIICMNCLVEAEKVFPVYTNDTSINIFGLKSVANYELKIYNFNYVADIIDSNNWKVTAFNFTTAAGGKPGKILGLHDIKNDDGSITLKWNPPFNKGGTNLKYVVKYGDQSGSTKETTFIIPTGTEDKVYKVQIYAQATINGATVDGELFTYYKEIKVKGGIPLTLTVAVAAGVVVAVIVFLLSAFCIWKKRHPPYLQVVRMENGAVQFPSKIFSHTKVYVDPTTYNAVDDAVQDFTTEINRKELNIGELLGGGEFAEVFKGTLYRNGLYRDVAIKTLKSGAGKRDRDDFFSEAAILGQFSDSPNVVKLEGVILKERPNLIILEYMSNGALDSYLQKNDNQFDVTQLLGMGRDVAKGMTYLSEFGFIHRDLAARNILVDEFNVCKVSDFGMSRAINLDDTYDTQGGKIPVRWTAPEAIQYKKFTSASDIWSYGILLWEILSFGERPYWDWGNYTVMERLNTGYRLPPPMNCPKVIHDLMLKSWHKDRTKRPKFKEIVMQIEQWISTPLLLREVASVVRKRDENLDYTVLETINKWLEAIGMQRYTETFLNGGYSTPRQILSLNMEDLEKLEIGPIGHKMKIYKAIQNTKIQVDARHNSLNGKTTKKYNLPIRKK